MRESSRVIALVVLSVLLFWPEALFALCPICKNALVNSPEGQQLVKGMNAGILLLLAAPFLVGGTIAVCVLKADHQNKIL